MRQLYYNSSLLRRETGSSSKVNEGIMKITKSEIKIWNIEVSKSEEAILKDALSLFYRFRYGAMDAGQMIRSQLLRRALESVDLENEIIPYLYDAHDIPKDTARLAYKRLYQFFTERAKDEDYYVIKS